MKVNTLVIGAGRSGTTTLCDKLSSHSEICFSAIKEVHYFSIPGLFSRGVSYFHSFFKDCESRPVIATSDTYLLMDHEAIQRIYDYNPEIKIIVLLRNPTDRTYSSYNYSVNYGHHSKYNDFIDSIEKEKNIEKEPDIVKRNNIGHFYGSLYHYHLSKWTKTFPRKNVLVLSTKMLNKEPEKLLDDISKFLNISSFTTTGEAKNLNPNAVPKSKVLERFFLDRDNLLRKMMRTLIPQSIKNRIIHSNIVDRLHNINRKKSSYEPLNDNQRKIADGYFRTDLEKLKNDFGVEL